MPKCLYSGCSSANILTSDSRVEVKTVLPNPAEMKKLKSKLQIKWKRNGEAVFHRTCWNDLLKSARATATDPHSPKLIAGEKILLTEAAKTAEFFDSFHSLKENAERCAKLIKSSKHCTAFTGAGISTSAGIGDFRGRHGQWTRRDHDRVKMDGVFGDTGGEENDPDEESDSEDSADEGKSASGGFSYKTLRPTYTHEALQKLMEEGYLKYIISQNCDGLHVLSGVSQDKLSELHGNVFIEICEKCKTRYARGYYVRVLANPSPAFKCPTCRLCHRTGNKCEKKDCRGFLKNSIINFGDNLEKDILDRAVDNAKQSDLMLCLGSSLMVSPANSLVEMTKEPHNLAICNRQKTHMDRHCGQGVRVFGDCDVFMREVMRGVLEPEDLKTWEEGRQKRLTHYDTLRVTQQMATM